MCLLAGLPACPFTGRERETARRPPHRATIRAVWC